MQHVILLLFVSESGISSPMVRNLRRLERQEPAGRCELRVIDICAEPAEAVKHNIVAIPTLIRTHPGPERRLIGDLSDFQRVLTMLGVEAPSGPTVTTGEVRRAETTASRSDLAAINRDGKR